MAKLEMNEYVGAIQSKKQEAHDKQWLYIEINAKDVMEELEPGAKNLTTACKAMLEMMLEGDGFIVEPKTKTKIGGALTIRYYVDNLSPDRKKFTEANA